MSDSFDPRTHIARPDELAGRVIAITGASSGIGRAVALACAKFGATVILIGRNARKLETVHGEIEAAGGPEPTIAVLDLEKALASDYDQLAAAISERDVRDRQVRMDLQQCALNAKAIGDAALPIQ